MPNFICVTCGTQYPDSDQSPASCPICEDDRQYVNWTGQQWITLQDLRKDHMSKIIQEEPGLWGIGTEPKFAIGQRALLVQAEGGNVLWDCISLVDDQTIEFIRRLGGLKAIAISHPHFYASMIEWSRAFGDVPIYLHEADRPWAQRREPAIVFWDGQTHQIGQDLTLIRVGGHFDGSQVLHWSAGADGKGALLVADEPQVVMDRRYVTFMYSYPNDIPLPARAVQHILLSLEPFEFDRMYGGWFGHVIPYAAKQALRRSAQRYLRAIEASG